MNFSEVDKRALVLSGVFALVMLVIGVSLFMFLTRETEPKETTVSIEQSDKVEISSFMDDYMVNTTSWGSVTVEDGTYLSGKEMYLDNRDNYYSPRGMYYVLERAIVSVNENAIESNASSFSLKDYNITIPDKGTLVDFGNDEENDERVIVDVQVNTVNTHNFVAFPTDATPGESFTRFTRDYDQSFIIRIIKEDNGWKIYDIVGRTYPFFFVDFFAKYDDAILFSAQANNEYHEASE